MIMAPTSQTAEMERVARGLPTKSAKIRALHQAGFKNAAIARFLKTRDQFVSNVLRESARRRPEKSKTPSAGFAVARLDAEGRIVVPAEYRKALALKEGDDLLVYLEGDSLRLTSRDTAIKRIQNEFARRLPPGVSLVDELIAERRREAALEEQDD
jgi:AbrB family looped-hinge helix DNA binding protein